MVPKHLTGFSGFGELAYFAESPAPLSNSSASFTSSPALSRASLAITALSKIQRHREVVRSPSEFLTDGRIRRRVLVGIPDLVRIVCRLL